MSKVAIITVGFSGMGLASAKRFIADDVTVGIGTRHGDDVDPVAALHEKLGVAVFVAKLDVRDTSNVAEFVSAVVATHGTANILLNTAVVHEESPVVDHQMICGMRIIKAQGWGRIINPRLDCGPRGARE